MSLVLALLLSASCPEAKGLEVAAQQDTACALMAEPPAAAPADHDALARLLDEPEFARARKRNGNVMAILAAQFFEWLKSFFESREAAGFAKAFPYAVLGLAMAVAAFGLSRLARLRRRASSSGPAGESAPLALRPAPEHLANARRLLATAPREAIREALLALLSSLEARRLARPDRVKTNRELCAELPARGASSELSRAVAEKVEWYDRVFYSLSDVASAEAGRFVEGVALLCETRP